MKLIINSVLLSIFIFVIIFLNACSRSALDSSHSTITIHFENKKNDQKTKLSTLSTEDKINPELLCFAINITGSLIKNTNGISSASNPALCDIGRGIFRGTTASGTLSADVPVGQPIQIELFGYLRKSTSDACPTNVDAHWNWPLKQIFRLDVKSNIAVNSSTTDVTFTPTWPSSTQNIAFQNQWPTACLINDPNNPHVAQSVPTWGHLNLASGTLGGTHFRIYGRIPTSHNSQTLMGSRFQIKSWVTNP